MRWFWAIAAIAVLTAAVSIVAGSLSKNVEPLPPEITFCGKTFDTSRRVLEVECSEPEPDIEALSLLPGLQFVRLRNLSGVSLAPLRRQRELRSIRLHGTFVGEAEALSQMKRLRSLDIESPTFHDTSVLAGKPSLTLVYLIGTQASDLHPLADATQLETLQLSQSSAVRDLSPLQALTGLKTLGLSHTDVADLGPLAQLEQLESLNLTNTKVADLRPLGRLANLQRVEIARTSVTDLSPLRTCRRLTSIDFDFHERPDLMEQYRELQKGLPDLPNIDLERYQPTPSPE